MDLGFFSSICLLKGKQWRFTAQIPMHDTHTHTHMYVLPTLSLPRNMVIVAGTANDSALVPGHLLVDQASTAHVGLGSQQQGSHHT